MIQYFFSFSPINHLVWIEIQYPPTPANTMHLQLPAWRPGRYQLQNFAKNIVNFGASDQNNNTLTWKKTSKNTWSVNTTPNLPTKVRYSYYANELNAGSSFVNHELVYINPVNLCMYLVADINKPVSLLLDSNIPVAGADFERKNGYLKRTFSSYYELFDTPFIISADIQLYTYTSHGVPFHIWIWGNHNLNTQKLIADFSQFTNYQIERFGKFPEKEYHFLWIIPYHSYYHGVEHATSTVMILGNNGTFDNDSYMDLLSLASHELYHAWNIAKIRPKELLPYDYTQENYFETCFVAEGVTTYMGDLVLLESGTISTNQYLYELETTFRRHFDEADNASQSLLESSFDLWVDGYEKGVPNKKVSVYQKGAVAALILDYLLRNKNGKTLHDVMLLMYQRFGNLTIGYTYQDYIDTAEEVYGGTLHHYFKKIIAGTASPFAETQEALLYFGYQLNRTDNSISITLNEV